MVRSKRRNIFLKLKSGENRLAYARRLNYCVKLLRQKKQQYFNNLSPSSITNNKFFWKTVSRLFTENVPKNPKIIFAERNEILIDDTKIAQTFNTFFKNIIDTLNTKRDKSILCDTGNETDPLMRAINKCSKHPSILRLSKSYYKIMMTSSLQNYVILVKLCTSLRLC